MDEGWKSNLAGLGIAGAMALGAGGAQARVTPDGQGGFTGGIKPAATVAAPTDQKPAVQAPAGFSKEYLQKAADPNRTGRYMISVEKAQELLKQQGDLQEHKRGVKAMKYTKKSKGIEPIKPRNFVAKNAINTGAGAHKNKKKEAKQKHVEIGEGWANEMSKAIRLLENK
jgi:hypothetical protein